MPKPQSFVEPHIVSYFRSSLYTRWLIIVLVAASFWFLPDIHRPVTGMLIVLAVAYNALLMLADKLGWEAVTDQRLMLVADTLLALVLVVFTGGIASPYLLVLALVIISGAYWYGMWVSVAISTVLAIAITTQQVVQKPSSSFPKSLVVQMLTLATIGIYVAWLTQSDRSERNKLLAIGTETEKERQQLLALINNMGDAVLVVDNNDIVVIHNQAAAALAGKDIHGQPLRGSIQFLDAYGQPAELKLKHGDDSAKQDFRVKAPDGSLVSVAISIAPYIVDRQNRGRVLIIHDVSQEKTIDTERREFIAVASHELRTPLTIAQGDISLLLSDPPKDPESVEMLNGALRSLQQLSHIISDLTNLSQVENNQLDVQLESLTPVALLQDFQSDYLGQAKDKGLDLKIDVDPGLNSATILTSRYVVGEILSIFVTNALKFTEKGSITLGVANPKDGAAGVTFSISDTGIGISQSDKEKIFKKFFQSEDYSTRVHGGTGLGLYIAQRLAMRITARLWFETELGKGSTFYLWVPPYSKHKQDSGKVAAAETKDFFNTV